MSLLAAPLEKSQIEAIRKRHPGFAGATPSQAKFWTEKDLDAYFSSNGEIVPREAHNSVALERCALLTRLRQKLAEARVESAPAEYRSLCRYLRECAEHPLQLPAVADCSEVQRQRRAPELLRAPVVVERARMWVGRRWNASFWRREYGNAVWKCRTRVPFFEADASHTDSMAELCTAGEFVDYMNVVQWNDQNCEVGKALAFPRVSFSDWPVFVQCAKKLFEKSHRKMAPAGVRDFSARWLRRWSGICEDMPYLDQLARLHRVSLCVPGSITRLHVESYNAHAWFTQVEGSRVFFVFPPQAKQLYEESGQGLDADTVHDYTTKASPVDIFFPSAKRHDLFKQAKAQFAVLHPGESLVLPAGWWYYSVVLEPSVTLRRVFWNVSNRGGIVDFLRDIVTCERQAPDGNERALRCLEELYEGIMDDGDPEDSELSD